MKIATWNVNSIRSRLLHVLNFLKNQSPEILLLQELKCINDQFPKNELKEIGYNSYINGQKAWNGVAILSKNKLDIKNYKIPTYQKDNNSRFLEAEISHNKLKKI